MSQRPVREPNAEHPISIEPTNGRVVVRISGEVVADTSAALTLRESTYPAVQYIPLTDVASELLARTGTTSYCPYKGDAGYFRVGDVDDAAWFYERPYPAVAAIAGHLAFYPDKAEISAP